MFEFNPLSPEFRSNPYPFYHMLREFAPVFHWEQWGMWFLTRYEDNVVALRDNRFGREWGNAMSAEQLAAIPEGPPEQKALWESQTKWMLLRDEPEHQRLKTLVHKAFTPRTIEKMRESIQTLTNDLLDKVQDTGKMDVIEDLAFALPITVISQMLGVPRQDWETLRALSRDVAATLELTDAKAIYDNGSKATVAFNHYIRDLANERRKSPQDDMLTALVVAEDQGNKLTEEELIANVILLYVAGHETTVNLIGNGTLALLCNPEQWEKLKNDPMLVKNAVEEMLRFDSPVQMTSRMAMENLEIGGQEIRRGQQVSTLLGAANRDPQQFADPDKFDITRANANQHIGFGNGIHYCLGAPLARIEAEIAFTTLIRRMPNLAMTDVAPTYRDTYVLRGMQSFPAVF